MLHFLKTWQICHLFPFIIVCVCVCVSEWAGRKDTGREEDLLFVRYFPGTGLTHAYNLEFSTHSSPCPRCVHPVRHTPS